MRASVGRSAPRWRRLVRSQWPIAGLIAIPLLFTIDAHAAPFPTRDQNPLLMGFGLPVAMPSRLRSAGEWSFAADLNWGSTSLTQSEGQSESESAIIVDAETRQLRLAMARALSDDVTIRLQVPYRYLGGGTLDGPINAWHDFFGLPEGARGRLPENQFRIAYAQYGTTLLDIDASSNGFGDLSADLGYQLSATPATSLSAWLSLKLPTGDADELTGSGAMDASLVMSVEHRLADRWSMFGQAAVSWLGDGDLLRERQRSVLWSALAGLGWRAWRGLELKLQLDAHRGAFEDTQVDYLGDTLVLTFGGDYRFTSGWRLDVGVSEDIVVNASPDVVFVIGVSRDF